MAETLSLAQLNQRSLMSFKTLFTSLDPPSVDTFGGVYESAFVGPLWLRKLAGPTLVLGGLGGWWGKKFDENGLGLNIVYRSGVFQPVIPMFIEERPSLIDGRSGLTIVYPAGSRFPWPYIVDELRQIDKTRLLGMTIADVAGLRHVAFPFLLHVVEEDPLAPAK